MKPRTKGLWAIGFTFFLTAFIHLGRDFSSGDVKANWAVRIGLSWNYFAFAFDKRMIPWQFVELKGGSEGNSTTRTLFFFGFFLIHLALLGAMAFADK